jgi:uncharacterized OB-fold protein
MELMTRTENWNITYKHALGETASYFFTQLRDNKQIYGRRDPKSGRVLVPPRAFSDETLEPTKASRACQTHLTLSAMCYSKVLTPPLVVTSRASI